MKRSLQIASFFFSLIYLLACGSSTSENKPVRNQPPKEQRPKLIAKKWHLDGAHYKELWKGYFATVWEAFLRANSDLVKDVPQHELDQMKAVMTEESFGECVRQIRTMYFDFRPDGTYSCTHSSGSENGTYEFDDKFEKVRLTAKGSPKPYSIPVTFISDSTLELQARLPIVSAAKDDKVKFYQVESKFVPF